MTDPALETAEKVNGCDNYMAPETDSDNYMAPETDSDEYMAPETDDATSESARLVA